MSAHLFQSQLGTECCAICGETLSAHPSPSFPCEAPAPTDALKDETCQCPTCGRLHRNLGFGKPPAGLSRPGEGDWMRHACPTCAGAGLVYNMATPEQAGHQGACPICKGAGRVDVQIQRLSATPEEMAVLWKAVTLLKEVGYHIPAGQLYEVIARAFPDSTKETK